MPKQLKYIFFGEGDTYLVIISSTLTRSQEKIVVKELGQLRKTIHCSISDIKGINLVMCMHKFILEDNAKTMREAQRRLIPNSQKVVNKEVLKLLDEGGHLPNF